MTSTLASIEHLKMLSIQMKDDKVTLDTFETIAKHCPTLEILHFDSTDQNRLMITDFNKS